LTVSASFVVTLVEKVEEGAVPSWSLSATRAHEEVGMEKRSKKILEVDA
jgi:hypothetical protein